MDDCEPLVNAHTHTHTRAYNQTWPHLYPICSRADLSTDGLDTVVASVCYLGACDTVDAFCVDMECAFGPCYNVTDQHRSSHVDIPDFRLSPVIGLCDDKAGNKEEKGKALGGVRAGKKYIK